MQRALDVRFRALLGVHPEPRQMLESCGVKDHLGLVRLWLGRVNFTARALCNKESLQQRVTRGLQFASRLAHMTVYPADNTKGAATSPGSANWSALGSRRWAVRSRLFSGFQEQGVPSAYCYFSAICLTPIGCLRDPADQRHREPPRVCRPCPTPNVGRR